MAATVTMPLTYAAHTPPHIAALFETIIAHIDAASLPKDASLVLCTSLPETADPLTHYICLSTDTVSAPGVRISAMMPPVSLTQCIASIVAFAGAPSTALPLGGGWVLQLSARMLEHASRAPVTLTELECTLLAHLARYAGDDISRDTLMRDIWHYEAGTQTHTLETHMYRLRGKLEKLEPSPCLIHTTETGYRLALS